MDSNYQSSTVEIPRGNILAGTYDKEGKVLSTPSALRRVSANENDNLVRLEFDQRSISIPRKQIESIVQSSRSHLIIFCLSFDLSLFATPISSVDAANDLTTIADIFQKWTPKSNAKPNQFNKNDIFGYYQTLDIGITCSLEDIKKAYKKKCLETHPDLNKGGDAHESFIRLQLAYEVLSNSEKRAEYDAKCVSIPDSELRQSNPEGKSETKLDPIKCSICNSVTAQPRYVVFWETISFYKTIRNPVQGIMCVNCAGQMAYNATRMSLLLGWWGFWGFFYTPISVLTNIAGGEKPAENNARILLHQSWYFVQKNRLDIAYYLATDSLFFLKRANANVNQELIPICQNIIDSCRSFSLEKRLDPVWLKPIPLVAKQWKAVGICAVAWTISVGGIIAYLDNQQRLAKQGAPEYSYNQSPVSTTPSKLITSPQGIESSHFPIPTTYLPLYTGYLPEKEIGFNNGHSTVTIENNSDGNFHVRLYKKIGKAWVVCREAYVRANEVFTMESLEPGEYQIRRLDVQTKSASKTDSFTLEENEESGRIRYSKFTLTFKAVHGNSRVIYINAKEF